MMEGWSHPQLQGSLRSWAAERPCWEEDGGSSRLLVSIRGSLICLWMSPWVTWVTGSKKTNCLFLFLRAFCSSGGSSWTREELETGRGPASSLDTSDIYAGTCGAAALRLLAVDGGEGGVGLETGVSCSRGGSDRSASSGGSSTPSCSPVPLSSSVLSFSGSTCSSSSPAGTSEVNREFFIFLPPSHHEPSGN